jgi:hypothetical protein
MKSCIMFLILALTAGLCGAEQSNDIYPNQAKDKYIFSSILNAGAIDGYPSYLQLAQSPAIACSDKCDITEAECKRGANTPAKQKACSDARAACYKKTCGLKN